MSLSRGLNYTRLVETKRKSESRGQRSGVRDQESEITGQESEVKRSGLES
jgi:hypothetical protein